MTTTDDRMTRAEAIASNPDAIRRIDEHSYTVKSQSGNKEYEVISTDIGWKCSCPDYEFRGVRCKHIHAVIISSELHKQVQSTVIPTISIENCPRCQSCNIVKHGVRHNKSGNIQRYFCNDCSKWFVINLGFEKMHATPKMITAAMQLYFTGESLRNVQKFLKLQGVKISHVTIYKWIGKYVSLMQKYLEQIKPNVSDVWRIDELYLKVKGNNKYLFALMDDETRFWIAQQVSDKKNSSDVRPLFKQSKEATGKRPRVLISDGASNFHEAYKKEFWTQKNPRTKHIQHIRIQGDTHNNKMERMNGEIRDREKTMRGLKKEDTSILKGYQLFHNYIRTHEGLNNKTPAEVAGIKIEGQDKWLTLIQNATRNVKENEQKKV